MKRYVYLQVSQHANGIPYTESFLIQTDCPLSVKEMSDISHKIYGSLLWPTSVLLWETLMKKEGYKVEVIKGWNVLPNEYVTLPVIEGCKGNIKDIKVQDKSLPKG